MSLVMIRVAIPLLLDNVVLKVDAVGYSVGV